MSDAIDPITGYHPENEVRSIAIEIDAPASVVWEILTDLPRYGEWNPFCIKAESTLELGAPIVMHLTNFWSQSISINTEYVCANDPERLLSWKLDWQADWPYAARRDQVVTSLGPDRCAYQSINAFYGDTGTHVMRFAGPWVKAAFDNTAHALKARAEAMRAGR
ncbi:MAG TPA: SRPBCC domain-containing protein [Bryobacteraceae bacterium]